MSNFVQNNIFKLYKTNSELRDAARTLRTNLEFAGIDQEIQCIAITSAEMSVGKSTIAISLGISCAEAGKRTLIIDDDFRNPQIASRLRIRSKFNIADLLSGRVMPEDACMPTAQEGLYVLDLGNRRINNPVEVMNSVKYKNMIAQLKNQFDFIIMDTPPIGMFIDAAVAAQTADGVVFVINSGKTKAQDVREGLSQLEKANVRVLGAVLNNVIRSNSSYYYYDRQGNRKRRSESGSGNGKASEQNVPEEQRG